MLTIITPTFNSRDRLNSAIQSVLGQSSPHWELIICPDDALDYSDLLSIDGRIKVVPSNLIASGPAMARNRGLNHASGNAVAYLDDDDQFTSNYVEESLRALQSTNAVLFPTTYIDDSEKIARVVGQRSESLTIDQFAVELGSLHVVANRAYFPYWHDFFAEDVIHTCETIDKLGGQIKVSHLAGYFARIRTGSICSSRRDIDSSYKVLTTTEFTSLSKNGNSRIQKLFKFRQYMNALFSANAGQEDYNFFISNIDTTIHYENFSKKI